MDAPDWESVLQEMFRQRAAQSSTAAPPTQEPTSVSPHTSEGNVERTGHTTDAVEDEIRDLNARFTQLTNNENIPKSRLRRILEELEQGRFPVIENDSKSSPNVKDVSQAGRIIRTKDPKVMMKTAREISDHVMKCKDSRSASGLHISDGNSTEQGIRPVNQYEDPAQYVRTGRILGEGKYAAIHELKHKTSDNRHALKMVRLSDFNKHELLTWVNVTNKDKFVQLLMIKYNGHDIHYHMELVDGVTLRALVDNHIQNLDHANRRLLSLYIFWSLLDALNCLHAIDLEEMKGACHRDIHSENVMLDRTTLEIKVLDFGSASPLNRGNHEYYDHDGLKSDVLNIVRIFCLLYINQEFGNIFDTEEQLVLLVKGETAKDIDDQCWDLPAIDKDELKMLLKKAHAIVADKNQSGYSDVQSMKQELQKCLEGQVVGEAGAVSEGDEEAFVQSLLPIMKEMAAKLFPAEDAEASGGIDMSDLQSQAPAPDTAEPSPQPTDAVGVNLVQPLMTKKKSKKTEGKQASSRK